MSNYDTLSLVQIQNSIKRKNDLIEKLQILEITESKDLTTKITAEEAELLKLLEALENKEEKPDVDSNKAATRSYERATKIMELDNALKHVRKLGPGISCLLYTSPSPRDS